MTSRLASEVIIHCARERSRYRKTLCPLPLHKMFSDIKNVQRLSLKDPVGNDRWQPNQIYLHAQGSELEYMQIYSPTHRQ